jgi:hypothetical protein
MEAGFFVNIDFLTWNWNLGKFGHSSLVRPGLDFFYGRFQASFFELGRDKSIG